jgi:hypothetical protein
MKRTQRLRLVHDVGKYVARAARNLPPEPTPEMIGLLIRDLYELRPGSRASAVFAALADGIAAPSLQEVRALFAAIDALEADVRAGVPAAVARAAALARAIEAQLRRLLEEHV